MLDLGVVVRPRGKRRQHRMRQGPAMLRRRHHVRPVEPAPARGASDELIGVVCLRQRLAARSVGQFRLRGGQGRFFQDADVTHWGSFRLPASLRFAQSSLKPRASTGHIFRHGPIGSGRALRHAAAAARREAHERRRRSRLLMWQLSRFTDDARLSSSAHERRLNPTFRGVSGAGLGPRPCRAFA